MRKSEWSIESLRGSSEHGIGDPEVPEQHCTEHVQAVLIVMRSIPCNYQLLLSVQEIMDSSWC